MAASSTVLELPNATGAGNGSAPQLSNVEVAVVTVEVSGAADIAAAFLSVGPNRKLHPLHLLHQKVHSG